MSEPGPPPARPRRARHRLPEDVLRLQQALLPTTVPLLPRADLAAAYLPAADPANVGGDWFDAACLPDGRLVLSVGEVIGGGLESVATMGQIRAVLSARLHEGGSLLESLRTVEALAARHHAAFATTLCVASLDLSTGVLAYATRGHPAPVVIGRTGARLLPATGDGPLGTRTRDRSASTRLSTDDLVLMFTDGMLRGMDERPARALERVRSAAGALGADQSGSPVVRLCEELPAELGSPADDSVLLGVQFRAAPTPLDLEFHADAERLAGVRAAVDDWAEDIGLASDDRRRVLLGVSELVANAVEHAYAGRRPGPVRVHAELTEDASVLATVADDGRWREPTRHPGDRGRGLSMSAALGLRVEIEARDDGTLATVESPARRPLRLLSGESSPTDDPGTGTRLTIVTSDRVTVKAVGPLAARHRAAQLEAEVRRVARNGLVPVDVDLREATSLSGTGIAAIESLLGPDGPGDVRIIADTSSAVGDMLALAGTPFAAEPSRRGVRRSAAPEVRGRPPAPELSLEATHPRGLPYRDPTH
ncbi:MAG: SpoIIE family protein phosphatase [Micrococcales bacterium]|nr:SpoIIE family protein phosphatase [Micrococcales bacterium]